MRQNILLSQVRTENVLMMTEGCMYLHVYMICTIYFIYQEVEDDCPLDLKVFSCVFSCDPLNSFLLALISCAHGL